MMSYQGSPDNFSGTSPEQGTHRRPIKWDDIWDDTQQDTLR